MDTKENKVQETEEEKKVENPQTQPTATITEEKKVENPQTQQVEVNNAKLEEEARNKIYAELGLKADDKNSVEMFKKFMRLQEKDKEEEQPNEKELELQKKLMMAEMKAEVMKAGVKSIYVDDAVALISAKSSDKDFKVIEAIKEFKNKYPIWFSEENKRGTGGNLRAGAESKEDKNEKSLGARLAAQKHRDKKSSFWSN